MAAVDKKTLFSKVDAFPIISFKVPPKTKYNVKQLKDADLHRTVEPIVPYLEESKIYFRLALTDGNWTTLLRQNFNRLVLNAASFKENDDRVETWAARAKFLQPKDSSNYCERTIAYSIDEKYFLVNPSFTFGIREAEFGTVHLYQTTAVPMYIYMFLRSECKLKLKEKLLPIKHQHLFTCHKLQSYTAYIVKPGVKYLIYTTRKTFFSCHVLKGEMELPYETIDVLKDIKDERKKEKEKPTVVDLYEKPPATPHMLDVKKIPQAKSLTQFKRNNPFDKFRMPKVPKKYQKIYVDISDPETDSEETHPETEQPVIPEQTHLEPEQEQTHPEQPVIPEQTHPEPQQPVIPEPEISPLLEIRQQWAYEYPLEKEVYITPVNVVNWYQRLKWKIMDRVERPTLMNNGPYQNEALNLSVKENPADTIMESFPSMPFFTPSLDYRTDFFEYSQAGGLETIKDDEISKIINDYITVPMNIQNLETATRPLVQHITDDEIIKSLDEFLNESK